MNLLEETKQLFENVRKSIVHAMQALHKVNEERAWEGQYSSFGEFVEDGLKISQGFASKLLSVNRHYLLNGGLSPEKLVGIDYEKLYLASKLPGTPDEQVAIASTLSRREIKETQNEEQPHDHEPICRICKIRL